MAKKRPSLELDLSLFGATFPTGAAAGFAHFQNNHKGKILTDEDVHQIFREVEPTRDPFQLGYFTGWIVALHTFPVPFEKVPGGSRVISLGHGCLLITPTDSFFYGYQQGKHIFRLQVQATDKTSQGLFDCLQVVADDKHQPGYNPGKLYLYAVGKLIGWLIQATRNSMLYEEILRGATMEPASGKA